MASAAEQRLLNYLTWLTLLLGILVGFAIAVLCLLWHDTARDSFISGQLAPPAVEGPVMFFLFGAVMATQWWRQRLRAQLQTIWPLGQNEKVPSSLYLLVNGIFQMGFGVFLLIDLAFDYALDIPMLLLVVVWLGANLWAFWYMKRRGRRQIAQP